MPARDFDEWAVKGLDLTLGGRSYKVRPPSTDEAAQLIAVTVRSEIRLGIAEGPIPEGVQHVLDSIGDDEHPALGDVHEQLVKAGVHPETIARMTFYATFFWAKGMAYADRLASFLWSPAAADLIREEAGAAPKAGSPTPRP